jgi:hypothetical protein
MDAEGHWEHFPRSTMAVLEGNPALGHVSTTFQYPPRVPLARPRSWATAAERFVDEQQVANGLPRLMNNVAPANESDDETMGNEAIQPGPSQSA